MDAARGGGDVPVSVVPSIEGGVPGSSAGRPLRDMKGSMLLAIDVPTMILTNTGDDIYFAAKRAALLRPDFSFLELEGGTHDIVDEQTQIWVKSVTDFL